MQNLKNIVSETQLVRTINDLVQSFEQIYVTKMQHVRQSVLETRTFNEGINNLFFELKAAYHQQVLEIIEKRRKNLQLMNIAYKQKETVAVLLSANEKLSGDINQKVFNNFYNYIQEHKDIDIVIAGKSGKKLFDQKSTDRAYHYYDLPEEAVGIQSLRQIINNLLEYKQVKVFYGKFNNFINQVETMSDISGESENEDTKLVKHQKKFLFEPSLDEILEYFENQIFTALFKQTVHESYLAQIGSRIMSLESTSAKIQEKLKLLDYEEKRAIKQKRNKKQLQSMAGITYWRK